MEEEKRAGAAMAADAPGMPGGPNHAPAANGPGNLFAPSGSAVISPCGRYRYRLERDLGGSRVLLVIMVNPSTADAEKNDRTISKVMKFARGWGFGRLIVANLCAYRATDVNELARVDDPVGPENDAYILAAAAEADMVVAAWGRRAKLPARWRRRPDDVLALLGGYRIHCIRTTTIGGDPEHPLFLPGNLTPQLFWVAPAKLGTVG